VESRRVRRTCGALGLLVVLVTACRLEHAPPTARQARAGPPGDTTVVLTELRAYYRDLSDRDWTAFSEHFWPDATITTVWRPEADDSGRVWTTSVPGFVAAAPDGPGSRAIFEESMRGSRITVSGELAQAWVAYRVRFGDPGAVAEWEGVDAFTLMQHQGRWRIVSLAFGRADGGS